MSTVLRNSLIGLALALVLLAAALAWIFHVAPPGESIARYEGTRPVLVDPDSQTIPTTGFVKSIGWGALAAPTPAPGLAVTRFASGLDHPRTMLVLPNGDVLVAETRGPVEKSAPGLMGRLAGFFMRRVGAGGGSPDTILLLRPGADGRAGQTFTLRHAGLTSPSGMAYGLWQGKGRLYIADHDAVLAFDYTPGATTLTGAPTRLMALPAGGNHWMRNLVLSPDGARLYVAVGSSSNIAEHGMAAETGRAAIWEIDLAHGTHRQYAAGMRNPNGMDWNPSTGELWAVVNERDQLGPNVPPDYLTNVPVGVHYGWPWIYWKDIVDDRVTAPIPEYLTDYTRKPEYAMGPHVAALGLAFAHGGGRLGAGFANGAIIARHGSWNRKSPVGYDVVFVRFDDHGNPLGLPQPVLTGFLAGGGRTHGRPTWVAWARDGALLVSDDTAGVIWRVIAPGAAPAPMPTPVIATHLPPQRQINSGTEAQFGVSFEGEEKVRQ